MREYDKCEVGGCGGIFMEIEIPETMPASPPSRAMGCDECGAVVSIDLEEPPSAGNDARGDHYHKECAKLLREREALKDSEAGWYAQVMLMRILVGILTLVALGIWWSA